MGPGNTSDHPAYKEMGLGEDWAFAIGMILRTNSSGVGFVTVVETGIGELMNHGHNQTIVGEWGCLR
jgi:hypothetical protein